MTATPPSRSRSRRAAGLAAASGIVVGAWAGMIAGCGSAADESTTANLPSFGNTPGNPNANGTGGSSTGAANPAVAGTCLSGQARCKGGRAVETCNSAGNGFDSKTCEGTQVCLAGACRQPMCTAGQTLCLGSEIHTCNADGKSTTLSRTCDAGNACDSSTLSCKPTLCEPLVSTCMNNTATRCDATGFAYDLSANKDCGASQRCNFGACVNPEQVTPNQITSNPLSPDPGQVNPTPTQTPMEMQMQAPAQACTAGQVACDSANTIGTCAADGINKSITRCPNGTNCQGAGQCMPVACNPAGVKPYNPNPNPNYPASYNGNGSVTVYWFAQGTLSVPRGANQDVNCGFNGSRANNDDSGQNDRVAYIQDPALFGAMNGAEYLGANACGACVQMSQGGRNVTITVADSCRPENGNPSCQPGHIDLSRAAFEQLTSQRTGNIGGVTWRYVPCAGTGNVQFQLKKADDPYWNEFVVTNHKYPLESAQVLMKDGRWLQATRGTDNFWLPPEGNGGGDMGTYRVRVTDINGGVIEEQLALRGGLQDGGSQFECQ